MGSQGSARLQQTRVIIHDNCKTTKTTKNYKMPVQLQTVSNFSSIIRPKSALSKLSKLTVDSNGSSKTNVSNISSRKSVTIQSRPKSAKNINSKKFNGTNSAMTFEEWTKKVEHRKLKEKQELKEADRKYSNSRLSNGSVLDSKSRSVIDFHEESAKGKTGLETGEYALILNNDERVFCYSKNERSSLELKKKLKVLGLEYGCKLRGLDNRIKEHYKELDKLNKEQNEESKHVKAMRRQFANQRKIQMSRFEKLSASALRRSSIEMQKQFNQTNLVGRIQSSPALFDSR